MRTAKQKRKQTPTPRAGSPESRTVAAGDAAPSPVGEHAFVSTATTYPDYLYCDLCGASETEHRL